MRITTVKDAIDKLDICEVKEIVQYSKESIEIRSKLSMSGTIIDFVNNSKLSTRISNCLINAARLCSNDGNFTPAHVVIKYALSAKGHRIGNYGKKSRNELREYIKTVK